MKGAIASAAGKRDAGADFRYRLVDQRQSGDGRIGRDIPAAAPAASVSRRVGPVLDWRASGTSGFGPSGAVSFRLECC